MQTAAKKFVDVLPGRINLGLVSFAGTANTLVTPTTDRAQVRAAIDNLQLAESTAIGEAIFTSLSAIENFQASLQGTGEKAPPARIVLLSDGYNTVGRNDTQAIAAAKAADVPVSTIAFGTDYGTLTLDGETVPVPVDRTTLQQHRRRDRRQLQRGGHARRSCEQVYSDLGSQIGYTTEPKDISPWFVRGGVLLALLGAVLSLLWTNRLLADGAAQRRGVEDELAGGAAGEQVLVRLADGGHRVAAADDGLQRALGDHRQQLVSWRRPSSRGGSCSGPARSR